MSDDQTVRDIAQAVTRYLEANPQATETIDGVARWWLLQSRIEAAHEDVAAALDLLVRR